MKPWKEFNRMHSTDNFYGCVAPNGEWFDSGMMYTTAVSFCCYSAGRFGMTLEEEAIFLKEQLLRIATVLRIDAQDSGKLGRFVHSLRTEAQGYLYTALSDWAVNGKVIASVEMNAIEETTTRCFTSGIVYPENFDVLQEAI